MTFDRTGRTWLNVIGRGLPPLALGLMLAGTGLAVEFEMSVRSIDEVADGALPTVQDITASDATIAFDSSIPLACSVVYGTTPDFGLIATDLDMAGGAHSNHHPIMAGLQPDTEYFWRVQGTSADGTVFVSEVQTFQTPALVASARVNLASLAAGAEVVAVSSNWAGGGNEDSFGANSALDGNRATAWSTAGDGNDGFIEVRLAQPAAVREVEVWTRTMSNNTARIFTFTLTSDDGQTFGPFELPDANQPYRFAVAVTTQTLRLDVVDSNGGNVGLVEFAIFR